jgi:hypothetical protein
MNVDRCSACAASLGTQTQGVLHGSGVPILCPPCLRNATAKHYLAMLPADGEREWSELSEWEQAFLASVRGQFAVKSAVSEKQFEILERLYVKLR